MLVVFFRPWRGEAGRRIRSVQFGPAKGQSLLGAQISLAPLDGATSQTPLRRPAPAPPTFVVNVLRQDVIFNVAISEEVLYFNRLALGLGVKGWADVLIKEPILREVLNRPAASANHQKK